MRPDLPRLTLPMDAVGASPFQPPPRSASPARRWSWKALAATLVAGVWAVAGAPGLLAAPSAVPPVGAHKGSARLALAAAPPFERDDALPAMRRVRLEFVDADVQEVFRALAAQTSANIVVAPEVKGTVTASLRDLTVEEALDAIARMTSVAYRLIGDTYYVAPKERLDAMFAAPGVTQTYTVHAADPKELVEVIKAAIPALTDAVLAGKSLLVLKGPAEEVDRALRLLPTLDVNPEPVVTPEPPITLIRELHYLDALNTASILSTLFTKAGLTVSTAPLSSVPVATGTSVGGTSTSTAGAASSGGGGESGGGGAGASGAGGAGGNADNLLFTNRLLLIGPQALLDRATTMLDQLDTPPRQLEIGVRVLDVNVTKEAQRGVTWDYSKDIRFDESLGAGGATPSMRVGTLARTSPLGLIATLPGNTTNGDTRVLAEPTIRVIEGRTANIFIGDTITAVVSRSVDRTTGVITVTTRDFKPGITLVVAAQATPDGQVTMDVRPTVSFLTSLQAAGTDLPLPQIRERSAQTTIRVKDGETMVLGGLLQDSDIKNTSKVPFLGDLPFFGTLFRSRQITKRRSEVVILLTPRILKP